MPPYKPVNKMIEVVKKKLNYLPPKLTTFPNKKLKSRNDREITWPIVLYRTVYPAYLIYLCGDPDRAFYKKWIYGGPRVWNAVTVLCGQLDCDDGHL